MIRALLHKLFPNEPCQHGTRPYPDGVCHLCCNPDGKEYIPDDFDEPPVVGGDDLVFEDEYEEQPTLLAV